MSKEFEKLLEENEQKRGGIIKAVIAAIQDGKILVDIGEKQEAILKESIDVKIGDEIEVIPIGKRNGNVIVSAKKAEEEKND